MAISSYKQLDVYNGSMELLVKLHQLTLKFPTDERFGLKRQIMRAAYSIPMNLAEGYGRGTRKDYAHFVTIARGSLFEIDAGLDAACRLGFIAKSTYAEFVSEMDVIGKQLTKLRIKLLAVSHGATN